MEKKEHIIKQNILSFFDKPFQSLTGNDLVQHGMNINELFEYIETLKKQNKS